MSQAASAPDVEELVRTVALEAIRRIQDALRFCPHSEVGGLLRALREARDLVRRDADADEMDTEQYIFRDSTGAPTVLENSMQGSHFESRWLSPEESAVVAAKAAARRPKPAEVRDREGPS